MKSVTSTTYGNRHKGRFARSNQTGGKQKGKHVGDGTPTEGVYKQASSSTPGPSAYSPISYDDIGRSAALPTSMRHRYKTLLRFWIVQVVASSV